jgi:hypothetical protein
LDIPAVTLDDIITNHQSIAGKICSNLKILPEFRNYLSYGYLITDANIGNVRETFFANQLSVNQKIAAPSKGDFLVDDKYIFEVGGKNKTYEQIRNIENSFIAADDLEIGYGNKIPLWLFGFLY